MRRLLRVAAAAAAGCAAVAVLAACGSSGSGHYEFRVAQRIGTLIPAAQRLPAESVSGNLLRGGTFRLRQDLGKVTVVPYPIVFDPDGAFALGLGNTTPQGLPYTMLIDEQGRVAAVWTGRQLSAADLQPAVHALEAGR